ncbi:MAG: G1 family glutamic endopeptidase [Acidimicrobiales bacterium]
MSKKMAIRRWKAIGTLAAGSYGGMAVASQPGGLASTAVHPDAYTTSAPPFPGAKHYNPTKVENLPGGGSLYTYDVNGSTQEYPVPPNGFDPLTATASQLQEYGFPPRPADPGGLAQWRSVWSHYRSTPTPDVWTVPQGDGLGSSPSQNPVANIIRTVTNGTEISENWSGWEATPPGESPGGTADPNPFTSVLAVFVQPPTPYTPCAQAWESEWVGLGGDYSGAGLIQDGTTIQPSSIPGIGPSAYTWYEYLNGHGSGPSEITTGSVTVKPGDDIYAYVSYSKTTKKASYLILDEMTGQQQSHTQNNAAPYYSGTTAELINERPANPSGQYSPLYNFHKADWTLEAAQYKNDKHASPQPLNLFKNHKIIMENSSGKVLAEPATPLLSQTALSVNQYHACS